MPGPRLYYLDDIPTPYRLGVQKLAADQWPGEFRLGFCAESEPGREWTLDFSGVDTEFIPGKQYRRPSPDNPFQIKWNPGVAKALAAWKPDVVILSGYAHPTMWRAARWCIRNKVPYALSCETSMRSSLSPSGWRWNLKRLIAGWIVRGMAFGLPVGREAAQYLRVLGPTDAPMHYFPNTPDTAPIIAEAKRLRDTGSEPALREKLGIPADASIFLFVGRLIDAKRPLDMLRAFLAAKGVENAVLLVIGDGPLMEAMKAEANGDPRILFTGWMKDMPTIFGLMSISTAMILPSESETWGAVVNETMAAGTPVVSSDRVGAAIELIRDGENGFLVPVGDVPGYTRAMERLVADPALAEAMGAAAHEAAIAQGEAFATGNLITGALAAVAGRP